MASSTIGADGSATHALRRLAGRFVRRAARALASPEPSDASVHSARKDLKRARTVLRLLRPVLRDRIYRRENAVLRDAAHALNAARDAKMLAETLQSLLRRAPVLRESPGVAELLGSLQAERVSMQRRLDAHPAQRLRMRRSLGQLCGRADHWRVGRHGWSVLGPALKRIYGRARSALPNIRPHPSDASLHEWRKRVKYVRYALEMLEPVRPRKLTRLARRAERLTDRLGQAHDLSVLAQKASDFAKRNRLDLEPLFMIVDRQRNRLAVDALEGGERLFRRRPRGWERRLARYCRR